jgi:subtilase family serine protease
MGSNRRERDEFLKKKAANAISIALITLLILPTFAFFFFSVTIQPSLRLTPLIAVAPDDPQGLSVTNPACVAPPNEFGQPHTSAFLHCYAPSDIYAAYNVQRLHDEGINGTGQTIVIVDSYGSPTALHDLQFFSQTFHLPAPDLTIINPTGTPSFNPAQFGIQTGWAEETSLDLQWAHSIAPDAKIVLIEANPAESEGVQGFPSIFNGEEFAVTHYPGSVLSQSFAVTEQSFCGGSTFATSCAAAVEATSKFNQVYQDAVNNNVTVFASAGDTGTANIERAAGVSAGPLLPFPTVQWPTSDPLVTSAGGTWLQYGWLWNPNVTATTYFNCLASGNSSNTCNASYLNYNTAPGRTEAVWKEDWAQIATGGGLSTLYTTPSFQSGISSSLLQGHRGVPDLSWNAAVDGGVLVYMSFPGVRLGWHIIGGTSASSPQLAGLIALTNQLASGLGKGPVGYLNPLLYQLPARDFNDIVPQTFGTGAGVTTLDSNTEFGTGIPGMATTTGWDLTTGFGSPNAYNFVHDLAAALPS